MGEEMDELRAIPGSVPQPPTAMADYLEKVRWRAYTVTDGDVDELLAQGISEDEIFEQTVAAAIGEGLRRFDAAEAAIP